MDIKGLAAIVTGGASGLGRATATMLAASGIGLIAAEHDMLDRGELLPELGSLR